MTMFIRTIPYAAAASGRFTLMLVEDVADRRERRAHVLRVEAADAADAEDIGDRELAGIDDEAPVLQAVVETLEAESGSAACGTSR